MNFFKVIWKNKGSRIWSIVSSILFALFLTITLVATQNLFIRETLSMIFGGERQVLYNESGDDFIRYKSDYNNKTETLTAANALNERIMEEGIILLKNEDNALPIKGGNKKISVFGKNSVNLVYGGSGSGAGATDDVATLYDSLENAGFTVNPVLKSFYNNKSQSGEGRPSKAPSMGTKLAGYITGETPPSNYTAAVKNSYSQYNDAALVVFSRIGGEGYDLPRSMKTSFDSDTAIEGARDKDDHYLQLDKNETDLLEEVCSNFDKVIVILNVSTSMELGFLDDTAHYAYHPQIKAALWIGSPGGKGINALGRVLNGSVNPSGRTVDTFSRNFKNDPVWQNFGNNLAGGGNRYTVNGANRPYYFVDYEEGIYIGYRYYETRGFTDGEQWYGENVIYPFGYGLSYTTFSWELINIAPAAGTTLTRDGSISATVRVTNNGSVKGKDVVQLYYTAPYYEGGIEKAHVVLSDFEKTKLLEPDESQDITITIQVSDMASYDFSDANSNGFKGYEMDAGDYQIKLMKNAHEVILSAEYSVPLGGFQYEDDTTTGYTVENRFDDVSGGLKTILSRSDWAGTWPSVPAAADREIDQDILDEMGALFQAKGYDYWAEDKDNKWYSDVMPAYSSKTLSDSEITVKLYDLIQYDEESETYFVDYNDPRWDQLLDQLSISQMCKLIGYGNFFTSPIENIVKPRTRDADGPAGFVIFMEMEGLQEVYGTCFYASECVIGATWNKQLAYEMGKMVGNEGIWGNERGDGRPYSGWYAPAVNIHRSPFSGRNWEYYSEDGKLSGKMAAQVCRGAREKGVYTYVKHFALNDQETDRDNNAILTWADEQTMREIYFKPFELSVKEGGTTAIMSSFNRIGTEWAGASYELLTEVLRFEWGFKGMVITDYADKRYIKTDHVIRAGGDLMLFQGLEPSSSDSKLTPTQVTCMRNACKNILFTVANSNAMNGIGEGTVLRYLLPYWVIVLYISDAVLVTGLAVWGYFAIRKSYKKKAN